MSHDHDEHRANQGALIVRFGTGAGPDRDSRSAPGRPQGDQRSRLVHNRPVSEETTSTPEQGARTPAPEQIRGSQTGQGGTLGETIPTEQAMELLAKVSLFAGLQPAHLRRIAFLGREESYGLGDLVFEEGAKGDKFYVILDGAVRISRTVPGMGEEALAVLRAGDYFGEMALIDEFPRSADARVHERCRLFVIRKEDMEDLLFVDRDLAYDLLWNFVRTLSGRLRGTNDKMTFLAVTNRF